MKLVYTAGPHRARTTWGVEQNIMRAQAVAAQVLAIRGLHPVCPHLNTRHMEGITTDDEVLAGTLELMRRCDAVILVGNDWERSAGTRAEVTEAISLRLPVLYAWGDDGYSAAIMQDLAATPTGYRAHEGSQDPFDGFYWISSTGCWREGQDPAQPQGSRRGG